MQKNRGEVGIIHSGDSGDDGECDAILQGHVETHTGMEQSPASSAKKAAASNRNSLTRSWNVSPCKGLLASATLPTSLIMKGSWDSPLQRSTPSPKGGFIRVFEVRLASLAWEEEEEEEEFT